MNKGITIFINCIGYYFDDYDRLIELLDMNCNDAAEIKGIENAVVFD